MITACIYGLVDPRDDTIHYVGVTRGKLHQRLAGHISESKPGRRGQVIPAKRQWIVDLKDVGLLPIIRALETVPLDEAKSAEQRWIERFRAQGASLTNSAPGGALGPPPHEYPLIIEKDVLSIKNVARIKQLRITRNETDVTIVCGGGSASTSWVLDRASLLEFLR